MRPFLELLESSRAYVNVPVIYYSSFELWLFHLSSQTSGVEKLAESLCVEMNFSSFRLRAISAPYLPTVPLSTSRKYAWCLFRLTNLDLKHKIHLIDQLCDMLLFHSSKMMMGL